MDKLIVRRARPSDKKAVTAFCSRIWEGWDYLPRVWEQWLQDLYGAFLVAELDGHPVGTDKVTVLSPGEVWLEGLRVDPDHQGQGVAQAMNRKAMEVIAGLKPKTVRFSTVSDNRASRHMGEQKGFHLMFQCQRMVSEIVAGDPAPELLGQPADIDAIMDYLESSSNFQRMKGLFAWAWTFKNLDRPFVERVVLAGGALLIRRGGRIGGLELFLRQRHGSKVSLGFIDGGRKEIVALARQLQVSAGGRGAAELLAMVPDKTVAPLSTAGFHQDEPIDVVVYELSGERLKTSLQGVRRPE